VESPDLGHVDRLARSLKAAAGVAGGWLRRGPCRESHRASPRRARPDLQDIVHELKGRGVALRATEQPVDTGTAAGKAFFDMLGVYPNGAMVALGVTCGPA
jgi:DNA invertase Pin-like site-specific DNA recombinase